MLRGSVRSKPTKLLASYCWAATIAAVAFAFLPIAAGYIKHYSIAPLSAAGIYGSFLVFLVYVIAPATSGGRLLLRRIIRGRHKALIVPALLVLPYLVYATGTNDFLWFSMLRLLGVASGVTVFYSVFPAAKASRFNLQDAIVAAFLISVVLFHLLKGIWRVPASLDFMTRLFVLSLGSLCWIYIRPVPDLGYKLTVHRPVLVAAGANFVLFAAIAVPLSLGLGFTSWNPRWRGLLDFSGSYLEIFLFIAVLEEIFFRGFLQNLLSKSFQSSWAGQLAASSVFGMFHMLHAPFPNWRYVVLASIAGWFYGSAYRSSGTLLSSALVHATVDTLWRTFLTR